jgi:hypothetical protein
MSERIEIGDKVTVRFYFGQIGDFFDGVVLSKPQDTGDCWIIKDYMGNLHHVQTFNEIIRFKN